MEYDWHQIFNNQARCAHTNLSIFDEKWTNTIIFYSLLCYLKKKKSFILHRSIPVRKMRETWSVAKLCVVCFFFWKLLNVVCQCYKQQKLYFLSFSIYFGCAMVLFQFLYVFFFFFLCYSIEQVREDLWISSVFHLHLFAFSLPQIILHTYKCTYVCTYIDFLSYS